MKQNLTFLFFLCPLIFVACSQQQQQKDGNRLSGHEAEEPSRPNIILVVVDDAGYVDFGFMGSEDLVTPQIDRLAGDGVVFTDAHVSATVCAPSRAGMLTGKYQQRFGFEANGTGDEESGDIGLAEEVSTLADLLQRQEYATIAIGKWHLGVSHSDHPNNRGFDDFFGFIGGGRSYFPMEHPSPEQMLQNNGERVLFDGYLTDVLGNRAVTFVEENHHRPFFMYLAFNAVHTPMEAKKADLERFEGHPRQELAAMTWSLDENVGNLRDKLAQLGLLENTLIYFISDNGGAHNNQSSNGPLKGWKGNKFEAGQRVPFLMSWPDVIPSGNRFEGLTSSLDIFATSLAAAGVEPGNDFILDGTNLLPYLSGARDGAPHEGLFWRKMDESAARVGDFKLISLEGYGSTLYNLEHDPGESNDLSSQDSVTFSRLNQAYESWESEMIEPLWDEGQPWMDVTYHIHQRLMENKEALYKSPTEKKALSYR